MSQSAPSGTGGNGGNGIINPQNNDVRGAASEDPKQNLKEVINSIQKTLGLLHQLYLTVSSYNAALQLPLLQRMYLFKCLLSS